MKELLMLLNEDTIGIILDFFEISELISLSYLSKNNILTTTSENHSRFKELFQEFKFLYKVTFFSEDYDICERKKIFLLIEKIKKKSGLHSSKLINILLLGDSKVGKTLSIRSKCHGKYSEGLIPDILHHTYHYYTNKFDEKKEKYHFSIADIIGETEYYTEKQIYDFCLKSHCFVLYYSIDDRKSFQNIKSTWFELIKDFVAIGKPVLLVASKLDLYDNKSKEKYVSKEEGMRLSKEMKCLFVEISTKTNLNSVKNMFEKAMILSIYHNENEVYKNRDCNLQ
eukprot:gene9044-1141_t